MFNEFNRSKTFRWNRGPRVFYKNIALIIHFICKQFQCCGWLLNTVQHYTDTRYLSFGSARLLWWKPRRWPEASQWHCGQRGGRHDALPAGLEGPHHWRNRAHAKGRGQLHHRGLLHLPLHALPESLHPMPQQGRWRTHPTKGLVNLPWLQFWKDKSIHWWEDKSTSNQHNYLNLNFIVIHCGKKPLGDCY